MGETHGTVAEPDATPKGSNDDRGSNQIPFIELKSILYEQLSQFIAERNFAVMLLLAFNVFDYGIFVPVRDGEYAVTVLPMCEVGKHGVLFDPTAGAYFDLLHQIRQANRRMQAGQDVNVVFNTVDPVEMTVLIFQYAPDVTKQLFSFVGRQDRDAVLGREDDVVIDLGKR